MKTVLNQLIKLGGKLAPLMLATIILAACGGRNEPTPTPIPPEPTATTAPVEATVEPTTQATSEPAQSASESPLAQPESPLAQSESPLAQPESPLTIEVPQNEAEAIALAEVTEPPVPQEGKGSLSGVIYSFGSVPGIIPGTTYYLLEAKEVDGVMVPPPVFLGPNPDNGDIFGNTSKSGQIFLDNVPPGQYFMTVWTVYNYLLLFPTPETGKPLLITVEEGDQQNLGVLYAEWP